ncbi:MAG TPA: heavy metal-binding domain-containing protein, partial [Chloroflexota bacterium]|nr:heavy metal-binding domain-containing protein [Chloroflexota bacterium]
SARALPSFDRQLLQKATYQITTGTHGLPMVQLGLSFAQTGNVVANPDLSLAVLIDRSGSMQETFAEGHVYDVASAILNYVSPAGVGYDLVFYDNVASDAGHISTYADLQRAIAANPPRGGTYITEPLRQAIQRYHVKRGIYVIVITDGEFADKDNVRRYIVDTLLPQLTPENPYAFRLHFVGAGHEVDHEFLQQLETAASGQGIQLVKHHHHVHLRHSHTDILDELDGAFLGIDSHAVLGQDAQPDERVAVTRVGNVATQHWREGNLQDIGFVPRRALLGLEFAEPHPQSLPVVLRYHSDGGSSQQATFTLPLPRSALSGDAPAIPTTRPRFHLPWRHASPEEDAARAAAVQARADLVQRTAEVRQAEASRQAQDMQLLGSGALPSMAQQRLAELRGADPEHATFTSDLSPDEAALLRRNGFRPIGLVSGSAMYHVGTAYASSYMDCEVTVLSQAYNNATRLAVHRMELEATALGAHGVIGVRFDIVRHEWADKTVEVQLLGTAIAGPDKPPPVPWLSDLAGQEWWALYRAGYEPAGLMYGHCVWFVLTTQSDEWTERSFANQELAHMSQALSQARHRALQQIQTDARRAGAVGVAGVHLSRRLDEIRLTGPGEDPAYEREHHNLTLSIIGTAVSLRANAPRQVPATSMVLSLREGRLTPYTVSTVDAKFE